jgi:hypothetical protein
MVLAGLWHLGGQREHKMLMHEEGGKSGPSTYTLWRKVAMMVERGLNTTDEEVKMREG